MDRRRFIFGASGLILSGVTGGSDSRKSLQKIASIKYDFANGKYPLELMILSKRKKRCHDSNRSNIQTTLN